MIRILTRFPEGTAALPRSCVACAHDQDEQDPSIAFVEQGDHFHLYFESDDVSAVAERLKRNGVPLEQDVHETAWGTRELVVKDDQGHTVYFGERL